MKDEENPICEGGEVNTSSNVEQIELPGMVIDWFEKWKRKIQRILLDDKYEVKS